MLFLPRLSLGASSMKNSVEHRSNRCCTTARLYTLVGDRMLQHTFTKRLRAKRRPVPRSDYLLLPTISFRAPSARA